MYSRKGHSKASCYADTIAVTILSLVPEQPSAPPGNRREATILGTRREARKFSMFNSSMYLYKVLSGKEF